MKNLKNLEDLFYHQLRDIYSAEMQLVDALPQMMKEATNNKLKKLFADHLEETKNQVERLVEIRKQLGIKLTGETCKGMKGLISEAKSFISESADDNVRDAGLIADAQRIEHYEISAYGTVIEYAKALGEAAIANELTYSLKEEREADELLTKMAVEAINIKAKV